jgi:hypothetical protein
MEHQPPETVTASEIANWVYCPESWRLLATGAPSVNQTSRDSGTAHHTQNAAAEVIAGGSIAIGWWLIITALIVLGLLMRHLLNLSPDSEHPA